MSADRLGPERKERLRGGSSARVAVHEGRRRKKGDVDVGEQPWQKRFPPPAGLYDRARFGDGELGGLHARRRVRRRVPDFGG